MRRLTLFMCLELAMGVLCALGAEFVSVTTANFESCRELKPGKIYRFAESVDFAAALGESAMSLPNGTAGIIVPAGVKVTLAGGAADGVLGGGAGIGGGAAYVLCAAADLRAFADGAAVTEYGPEICGADGSVTFKGVCRPAEGRGFFTIRCER